MPYNFRKAPASSGMDIARVRSDSSARSDTKRSRSKSMLAPDVIATRVWSVSECSWTYFFIPATANAPAGSRITRLLVLVCCLYGGGGRLMISY